MHERAAEALRAYLGEAEAGPVSLTPACEAYNDRRLAAQGIGYDGGGHPHRAWSAAMSHCRSSNLRQAVNRV